MPHLLIIGGSDAGISAALRARELKPETEVTMVLADRFPNFSICGLPFFLSGEVGDWRNLAHRTTEDIEREGIRVMTDTRAVSIDPIRKTVGGRDASGRDIRLSYDKLVIGTGAVSAIPPLPGMDHPGVLPLRWMADAFAFRERLERGSARSLLIVGAGYTARCHKLSF